MSGGATGIEWQIAETLIKPRLLLASRANGYCYDFNTIRLEADGLSSIGDIPSINIIVGIDTLSSTLMNIESRATEFEIVGTQAAQDGGGYRDVQVASRLSTDIVTALFRHPDLPAFTDRVDPNFGDVVEGVQIRAKEFDFGDDSVAYVAARIDLTVSYRARIGDHSIITA